MRMQAEGCVCKYKYSNDLNKMEQQIRECEIRFAEQRQVRKRKNIHVYSGYQCITCIVRIFIAQGMKYQR